MKQTGMIAFKVAAINKMVSIDNDDISFGLIADMYKGPTDGFGLQLNNEEDRAAVEKLCLSITDAVKEYLGWKNK